MAKNKKVQEKLRTYYRGSLKKPTKVADEQDMQIISKALVECVPLKSDNAFKCRWKERQIEVKFVVGLSSSLRHLKHKRTLALIFDDTASEHLANLLVEYASKLEIPIVKAHRLIEIAPKLKLKTLLLISLVEIPEENALSYNEKDPRPKPVKSTLDVESFRNLADLLQVPSQVSRGSMEYDSKHKYSFKPAQVDHIKSTGNSKAKKQARKEVRKTKRGEKNS